MIKQILATMALVAIAALPAPARALPLIDIGLGAGVVMKGSDHALALSAGIHVPLGFLFGAEASYTRTLTDGSVDRDTGSVDYSGSLLGGFVTLTSPSPGIKLRGKLGLQRASFDLDDDADGGRFSSIEPALGVGVLGRNWQLELTRSRIDDRKLDQGITSLSLQYVW